MSVALPHGDPEGMRALASTWLARAEELGSLGGEVSRTLASAGFKGPAATRLARHADALRQEGMSIAGALQSLAEELVRDAALVESLNAEARRADGAAQAEADTPTPDSAGTSETEDPAAAPDVVTDLMADPAEDVAP